MLNIKIEGIFVLKYSLLVSGSGSFGEVSGQGEDCSPPTRVGEPVQPDILAISTDEPPF